MMNRIILSLSIGLGCPSITANDIFSITTGPTGTTASPFETTSQSSSSSSGPSLAMVVMLPLIPIGLVALPFAYSSGYPGENGKYVSPAERRKMALAKFIKSYDIVQADIAYGDGDGLDAICEILEIDFERINEFKEVLQKNFDEIYPEAYINNSVMKKSKRDEIAVNKIFQIYEHDFLFSKFGHSILHFLDDLNESLDDYNSQY